jgi:RecB family exonuclease
MEIQREYLGWDRPALPEAARRLRDRYRQERDLDLGKVIVVLPGQRAGRRLQELLAFLAEDANLRFTPPQVVTEGRLPEMLYAPKQLFASEVVQDLAWARALRELPVELRQHAVPHPPADTDALGWLQLGKVLRGLHVELAADGLDFAAAQRNGPKLPDFSDGRRWETLVEVQAIYHQLLDREKLWDKQTARLKAIEYHEIRTDCKIVLLGTVDLNNTLRLMLDQVADRVTAYVIAPENLADHFDEHGCLMTKAWCDTLVFLRDEQLCQVDGPEEQTDAVSRWLAELDGRFRNDEVVIGVPDESLVPQLQRQLEQCGVQARWVEGIRLADTGPYRLLAAAVRFGNSRRYEDLAALLRHPDLDDWLHSALSEKLSPKAVERQANQSLPATEMRPLQSQRAGKGASKGATKAVSMGAKFADAALRRSTQEPPQADNPVHAMSLPAQLDRFYNAHLPSRVYAGQRLGIVKDWPDLPLALRHIDAWLAEAAARLPLREWGDVFRQLLGSVYGHRTIYLDQPTDETLHRTILRILAECDQLGSLPEALDATPLSAADAFRVALGPLADEALPPPADLSAVEILGWLELPLDDSRAQIVTSFNEGFVPQSTGADAFLPDRFRRELGLLHNERRYARDAYATNVLCQSREKLSMIFARRDTNNDPLQPSRLMFACPDDALIRRAQMFFGESEAASAPRRLLLAPDGAIPAESRFRVPPPEKSDEKMTSIFVTQFKDYLACPYRYYLRHVRNLKAIDDSARELDGGDFGSVLHEVLSELGRDPNGPRDSNQETEIFEYLDACVQQRIRFHYGAAEQRASIRLQLEQARQRLRAFAREQAKLVREGWRIVHAEDIEETRGWLSVSFLDALAKERRSRRPDGESILLVGRIDRIDFHEARRMIRILDYKTADSAQKPDQTHRTKEGWIDLQLPLYHLLRHAVRLGVPEDCQVELGYFNLPKRLEQTGVEPAAWDEKILETAYEEAQRVIRGVREGIFLEPVQPAPSYYEEFAAICLDNVLSAPAVADEDSTGVGT